MAIKKISRKQRRAARQNNDDIVEVEQAKEKFNLKLKQINPLTDNQRNAFAAYEDGQHLLLAGTAGTGKSFLGIYLALNDIVENETEQKLVIVRSIVSVRDMGFLPGSAKDKSAVYEAPYSAIFSELFGRSDAYEYCSKKGMVTFMTTSFVRGITINDAIIVIDELQNMTPGELHSIFTRVGKNCRVIFAGDLKQNDLTTKKYEQSGFRDFFRILNEMRSFTTIEFTSADVVRSGLVREYILTRERLEDKGIVDPL
jgi:phosphate starvation-inducible protein PhoH